MPEAVIAALDDLMFQSRIRAVATALGTPVSFARTLAAFEEQLAAHPGARVIVDFDSVSDWAADAVARSVARVPAGHTVAFLAHARVEAAEAARNAGAHDVLPRSRFVDLLPDLLA